MKKEDFSQAVCISANSKNLKIGEYYYIDARESFIVKSKDGIPYVDVYTPNYEWLGMAPRRAFAVLKTEAQAREFYRDLCGTVYGDANINSQGIMSAEHIADLMGESLERTTDFLWACARYRITERQGGAWVV